MIRLKNNPPGFFHYGDGLHTCMVHETARIHGDVSVGHGVRIDANVVITGDVVIGENTHICAGVVISGAHGVVIGQNCSLSAGVRVFTESVNPDSADLALHAESLLGKDPNGDRGSVVILDGTTIGANTVILPGVKIGAGCVIGALSVVNRPLPDGFVCKGAPCRPHRARRELNCLK